MRNKIGFQKLLSCFTLYPCVICSFSLPAVFFFFLAHVKQAREAQMFAELEVRCWQQSITAEHEANEKDGRKKMCMQFELLHLLAPYNPPAPSFITFLKIGD